TTAAALKHFTVNYTITNLPYNSDLQNLDSAKFKSTQRVMNIMVSCPFHGHGLDPTGLINLIYPNFFRPGQNPKETGVDAVCSYKTDSAASSFDRVNVYHEVRNKTNGITNLGIYSLDQQSLYING
ncbi:MUC16 protein, partial [Smithornis capensis]|nr:MUC16 protein [Smithornis capensis]